MKLVAVVGLGRGHIVLDGDPAPPKKGAQPQFSAHICCCQAAGLIVYLIGTKVGLVPGDIVLDGNPSLPSLPLLGPCIVQKMLH